MDIVHENNSFYIGKADEPLGKLEYRVEKDKIIVDRVFVVAHLKGQGIANDLLTALLNFAKENNYSFDPKLIETSSKLE